MKLSIESYIYALQAGCVAPELESLHLPLDHIGKPSFHLTRTHLTFRVNLLGTPSLLTIPFECDQARVADIIARLRQTAHLPFMAGKRFVPNALTVTDESGNTHLCHALVEPEYDSPHNIVRKNYTSQCRQVIRNAIANMATALQQLEEVELQIGHISPQHICFDQQGALHLIVAPIMPHHRPTNLYQTFATVAVLLYIGGCDIEAYKLLHTKATTYDNYVHRLRSLATITEHYGLNSLAHLGRLALQQGSPGAFVKALGELALEPFCPLPLLCTLLSESTQPSSSHHPSALQGQATKVSLDDYEALYPPCEQICRAFKQGYWHFITVDSTEIPTERPLIAAYDFCNARAVVRTERGYGAINPQGGWVMRDVWDDILWHAPENIFTAASDNIWHIYNRQGQQLSTIGAEWMGDASEGYVIARRGAKYAYYSTSGTQQTDFCYDEAHSFNGGVALVEHRGSRHYIDSSFHQLSPAQRERILAAKR